MYALMANFGTTAEPDWIYFTDGPADDRQAVVYTTWQEAEDAANRIRQPGKENGIKVVNYESSYRTVS